MASFDPAKPNLLRHEEVVDEYPGGAKVADPYRWLEDPDGVDTVKWVVSCNPSRGVVFLSSCLYLQCQRNEILP